MSDRRDTRPARPVTGMRRVLVAGATGYLGGYLVTELKRRDYQVRVLVRRPEQAAALPTADEVFVGQVTEAATLRGVADGVDTVFSSIGVTRPRGHVDYDQVDYGGNRNLLREAESAGVARFVYIGVLHGRRMRGSVRLAGAKERFVAALSGSPVAHTVVRPTGFFSDMRAYLDMAARGRVYIVGDGTRRINPVSGRDLAEVCVDAAASGIDEIEVGGPEVFTHEQIARLAAGVAGRGGRVTHIPVWMPAAAIRVLRPVTPVRVHGPLQFLLAVLTADMVAPATGTDRLGDFFRREYESATPPHEGKRADDD